MEVTKKKELNFKCLIKQSSSENMKCNLQEGDYFVCECECLNTCEKIDNSNFSLKFKYFERKSDPT